MFVTLAGIIVVSSPLLFLYLLINVTFLPTALQSPSDQPHWLLVFLWTLCVLPPDLQGTQDMI